MFGVSIVTLALIVVNLTLACAIEYLSRKRKERSLVYYLVIAAILINSVVAIRSEISASIEKRTNANTGKFETPLKAEVNRTVTLFLGSNGCSVDWRIQDALYLFKLCWGEDHDMRAELSESGRLLISGTFYSIDGRVVAEMVRNEWQLNPNNFYKRNYSSGALEVINEEGQPILQVELKNGDEIHIRGTLVFASGLVLFVNETQVAPVHKDRFEVELRRFELKPMFRYPESLHLGELVPKGGS